MRTVATFLQMLYAELKIQHAPMEMIARGILVMRAGEAVKDDETYSSFAAKGLNCVLFRLRVTAKGKNSPCMSDSDRAERLSAS